MSMKYYEEQQEKAKALVQKVNPDEENPPKDEDDI